MLSTNDDILKAAEDWRKEGREVALATVVETWGSAPRPVGSNLSSTAREIFGLGLRRLRRRGGRYRGA